MYLDTDIILALIKKNDWLKPFIKTDKISKPVTSSATLIEIELVVSREFGKDEVNQFLDKVKKMKIKIHPVTDSTVYKSAELMKKYDLTIFDAIHAACCAENKENIVSSDTVFDSVNEIKRIDPREL